MAFTLRSPAFEHGHAVPRRFTCDGDDLSPALEWSGTPAGTEALALMLDDPDAPSGRFTHWLVADLPAGQTGLDEDEVPNGTAVEGTNDFGRVGYGGPCPPRGRGAHRYEFHLYALAQPLKLERGFTRRDFEKALRGHVLATAVLQGTCERRG
jgi:Raf kinase inhibitor-like YbhB/YbcL family protein